MLDSKNLPLWEHDRSEMASSLDSLTLILPGLSIEILCVSYDLYVMECIDLVRNSPFMSEKCSFLGF
jgi:hypothetical protein